MENNVFTYTKWQPKITVGRKIIFHVKSSKQIFKSMTQEKLSSWAISTKSDIGIDVNHIVKKIVIRNSRKIYFSYWKITNITFNIIYCLCNIVFVYRILLFMCINNCDIL